MSKTYLIHMTVAGARLAEFMTAVSPAIAIAESFEAIQMDEASDKPQPKARRRKGPVTGNVHDTLAATLATKPVGHRWPIGDLQDALEAAGFSRNSASPGLSRLINDGKVTRLDRNLYALTETKEN